jgi:hypothetical protein
MVLVMRDVGTVREAESRAVSEFLARAQTAPAGLVFEGEPGIGKTTLWADAVRLAAESGFRVTTRTMPSRPLKSSPFRVVAIETTGMGARGDRDGT